MTTYINDNEYLATYEHKKSQAEKRFIPFEFTFEEFKVLLRLKHQGIRCAYTNQKFHTKGGHKYTASLERIDGSKPYCKENVIYVTTEANKLKNFAIELKQGMKGLTTDEISIVHRITKILNDPQGIERIMLPYKQAYDKMAVTVSHEHDKKMEELREQSIKMEKEAAEKAAQEELKSKLDNERSVARTYLAMSDMFTGMGVEFELTIKEWRDKTRTTRCMISGEKFASREDMFIWVKDKSQPLTKDNCIICKKEVQQSIDFLAQNGNIKTCLGNLVKILLEK